MRNGKKIFWGSIFILGAASLILANLGMLEGIAVWKYCLGMCMLLICGRGILRRSYFGILMPIAITLIVFAKELHIESIAPWPILFATILLVIGLSILFPIKHRFRREYEKIKSIKTKFNGSWDGANVIGDCNVNAGDTYDGSRLYFKNTFGESIKYAVSENLESVVTDNSFGKLQVYFNNAKICGGQASVTINNAFGETSIYVPSEWVTDVRVTSTFGSVSEHGNHTPCGEGVLIIKGSTTFGELQIHYI